MENTRNIISVSYRFVGNKDYEYDLSETLEGVQEMFDSFNKLEQEITDITITIKADNLTKLETILQ